MSWEREGEGERKESEFRVWRDGCKSRRDCKRETRFDELLYVLIPTCPNI